MSAPWPLKRAELSGVRVRLKRRLCNHDGPVKEGTLGTITTSRSLFSFTILTDACGCCGLTRRVDYVTRDDVEVVS